ncbi:flagellar hook-length control protein FliK [Lachnospiraceae bacterium 62-35]
MEGTVKMQSAAMAKIGLPERSISTEASKKLDDFEKLLQNKKNLAGQPKQAEDSKAQKAKTEETGTVENSLEGKEKEDGAFIEEDSLSEEAMQQAALQQAAAQMSGLLLETQAEPDLKALETLTVNADISANAQVGEAIVSEEGNEAAEMISQSEEEPALQVEGYAVQKHTEEKETKPAGEKAGQVEEKPADSQIQEVSSQGRRTEQDSGTKEQENQNNNMTGSDGRKAGETVTRDNSNQVSYGAEAFRVSEQTEDWMGMSPKTESIPLKTMPESLPEDLGKALAAKMPENGRTLTVELEPASLGKLTIRLVYEGSRAAVSIMASNPKTLELLNQKASEIAAILEEKTGQETLIYTHQAEQERDGFNENPNGHSGQEDREDGQREKKNDRDHSESFIQQLRLGLV